MLQFRFGMRTSTYIIQERRATEILYTTFPQIEVVQLPGTLDGFDQPETGAIFVEKGDTTVGGEGEVVGMPRDIVMIDGLAMDWHGEKLTQAVSKLKKKLWHCFRYSASSAGRAMVPRGPALLSEYAKQWHASRSL